MEQEIRKLRFEFEQTQSLYPYDINKKSFTDGDTLHFEKIRLHCERKLSDAEQLLSDQLADYELSNYGQTLQKDSGIVLEVKDQAPLSQCLELYSSLQTELQNCLERLRQHGESYPVRCPSSFDFRDICTCNGCEQYHRGECALRRNIHLVEVTFPLAQRLISIYQNLNYPI